MLGFELSPNALGGLPPVPLPLADFFRHGGGRSVAVAPGLNGGLSIWSEVGPRHAACLLLDNDDPTTRFSWRETLIAELRNIYPVGALTLSGSWSKLQSSGSGISGSYTGNRAVSTGSTTARANVAVDRAKPYDLWVHFTGRTNGGYVKVEIDNSQDLVNEITDPASLGFKAFSAFNPTDLLRRQTMKVASGLTGAHDVTLSYGGVATPGGNAIMIEAVSTSGALSDPFILPPLWEPGKTYEMGDEVQSGGTFYAARGNGPSGTAPPVHTNGIASDGALDWRADFRPTYPEFVSIDYASEREYAVRFAVGVANTEVGGQTHGNEVLTARDIVLDGVNWSPNTTGNGLSVGQDLMISEATTWQTEAGIDVATCQLVRSITPAGIRHDVHATGAGPQADIEWLYAGMLPLVCWDGESAALVVDTVAPAQGVAVTMSDYAGQNPPNIDFTGVARLGLTGAAMGETLHYGHEAGALTVTGNPLTSFSAFLRPNLDARSASGSLDWTAKAYVQASAPGGVSLGAGDIFGFYNRHVISVA
jgi:hypothetical protein